MSKSFDLFFKGEKVNAYEEMKQFHRVILSYVQKHLWTIDELIKASPSNLQGLL